jgi:hypothetical protein
MNDYSSSAMDLTAKDITLCCEEAMLMQMLLLLLLLLLVPVSRVVGSISGLQYWEPP